MARLPHDGAILDALVAMRPEPFSGPVWRVTRADRPALRGSLGTGRWSPGGDAEILYTSLEPGGALAEIGFRLGLEPVWPSRLSHELHRIEAQSARNLQFADVGSLVPLGVDAARWQGFDYAATQAIAAAAHFLEYDGLIVPSARAPNPNLVVFLDRATEACQLVISETTPVDWKAWRQAR